MLQTCRIDGLRPTLAAIPLRSAFGPIVLQKSQKAPTYTAWIKGVFAGLKGA